MGGFHAEGLTPDQIGETVFAFGCYVGEVLVRNNGGRWVMPGRSALAKLGGSQTMVVELPNGDVWNPIGRAFKLLQNGEPDSVVSFYRVATQLEGDPPRAR